MEEKKIFINYRRSDSQYMVDDLYEQFLQYKVPRDWIFKDVESIGIGTEFDVAIDQALAKADIVLIVIGKTWLSEENKRRLHDPDDFVRREVAKALQLENTIVVPVLFDAPMPAASELPEDLKDLPRRNAFEISRKYKDQDIRELMQKLQIGIYESGKEAPKASGKKKRKVLPIVLWVALVLVLLAVLIPFIIRDDNGNKVVQEKSTHTKQKSPTEKAITQKPGKESVQNQQSNQPVKTFAYTQVDAATEWPEKNKVYIFSGNTYVRYDLATDQTDEGYPTFIKDYWPGIKYTPEVNAVMKWDAYNAVYFFMGGNYDKWLIEENQSAGNKFPKSIAQNWPGIFTRDIDACMVWYNRHVAVFFKGSQYLEYDMKSEKMRSGFPRKIAGNWKGLPWNSGIDAAFTLPNTNKAVLFRGTQYVLLDLARRRVIGNARNVANFSIQ